jgi:hypothetical protein
MSDILTVEIARRKCSASESDNASKWSRTSREESLRNRELIKLKYASTSPKEVKSWRDVVCHQRLSLELVCRALSSIGERHVTDTACVESNLALERPSSGESSGKRAAAARRERQHESAERPLSVTGAREWLQRRPGDEGAELYICAFRQPRYSARPNYGPARPGRGQRPMRRGAA